MIVKECFISYESLEFTEKKVRILQICYTIQYSLLDYSSPTHFVTTDNVISAKHIFTVWQQDPAPVA